ncbi:hypothetical protein HY483_03765 [Candidatus Woesearchaeota archaeon]|nr:hypothetical protein [Candidatus Woesearchaeota archaeon]
MRIIIELDKDLPTLALSEALSICNTDKYEKDENILILETSVRARKIVKKISLARAVYKYEFSTKKEGVKKKIREHTWSFKEPIKVITRNATPDETKKTISETCKKLEYPKVSMEKPKTRITYIFTNKKAHCGILIGEPKLDLSTAMEKMPAPHPSAMKPRIVKALINIAQPTKSILDPFCGAGGFIVQASKMGYETKGWDIDKGMIWRAKKNTATLKNVKIKNKNALTLKKAESIIADLPYGKNTRKQNMKKLYEQFFKTLKKTKFNNAVLILPKSSQPLKIAKKTGLKITKHHEIYVHGTLTRIVMEVKKN